jgi:phage terminase small subunit
MAFDAPKYRKADRGVLLGDRLERFCGHFLETRNASRALRLAFVVDKSEGPGEVIRRANEWLAEPEVAARIKELRDAACLETIVHTQELMRDWHDIAVADPNEIIAYVRENCRFCHGINGQYQWKDAAEWIAACEAETRTATKEKRHATPPGCEGGFGFNPVREPNYTCAACYGEGLGRVRLNDTTKLSGPARKLYAGIKVKADGSLEVQLHDQMKAREQLARCKGAFKDLIPVAVVPPGTQSSEPVAPDRAAATYLQLIHGGKRG